MASFQAVFYRRADRSEPVRDYVDALPAKRRVTIRNQIDRLNLLNDQEPHLPFPHSSQIEGELRELRCHHGNQSYRVLYRRSGNLVVLLHMFLKTTEQVPEADKQIARDRWEDFESRMNAEARIPPRAAGRDAPGRKRRG